MNYKDPLDFDKIVVSNCGDAVVLTVSSETNTVLKRLTLLESRRLAHLLLMAGAMSENNVLMPDERL